MGPSPYYFSIDLYYDKQNIQLTSCLLHCALHAEHTILHWFILGRVKENVYTNQTASKTSTRLGISSSLVMISGRSDQMSLKSIRS